MAQSVPLTSDVTIL